MKGPFYVGYYEFNPLYAQFPIYDTNGQEACVVRYDTSVLDNSSSDERRVKTKLRADELVHRLNSTTELIAALSEMIWEKEDSAFFYEDEHPEGGVLHTARLVRDKYQLL